MRDAQLRVNEANIRSVKGAAATEILANWTKEQGTSTKYKYSEYRAWSAEATVEADGTISGIVVSGVEAAKTSDYTFSATDFQITPDGGSAVNIYSAENTLNEDGLRGVTPKYVIKLVLTNVDIKAKTA